jgi:class 3 adenylate cyclase
MVKVQTRLATLITSALSQSMPVDMMQRLARTVIRDYDIYQRSGFPSNIPMPRADAARHILKDFVREGFFLRLVESLINMASQGNMGREVRIPLLPRIIAEVEGQGYRYSREKGVFLEAVELTRTMGWGTLETGKTYEFALLRFDIAGNSRLVRRYPEARIKAVYGKVKDLVTRIVEKREGRIWSWEGDGGLAAFYFVDKTIQATLCGMEVLHELFLYNLLGKGLPEPVLVRLAVHAGPCRFLHSAKESAGDTIRRVELLESSYTHPGCLTVSPGVFTDLGSKLSPHFTAVPGPDRGNVYRYGLGWEKK